jgi:aconitate hydratase
MVFASVLSGNRNFEARVHQSIRANFLMSPPLVVAYALAGRVDIDLTRDPIGPNKEGQDVYLREIWPSMEEVNQYLSLAFDAETYRKMYQGIAQQNPTWNDVPAPSGHVYEWEDASTYVREPPYFDGSYQPRRFH